MDQQRKILERRLRLYYNEDRTRMSKLRSVLLRDDSLSLRRIHRFLKGPACVYIKSDGTPFRLQDEYRTQVGAYTKRLFDPFCRHNRIILDMTKGTKSDPVPLDSNDVGDGQIKTTVGQLNFFRWAIENEVLDFIHRSLADGKVKKASDFQFVVSFD